MSEVTRTNFHTRLTSVAAAFFLHHTHTWIVDCMEIGLKSSLVVDGDRVDFGNRHSTGEVGREDAKLEGRDLVLINS